MKKIILSIISSILVSTNVAVIKEKFNFDNLVENQNERKCLNYTSKYKFSASDTTNYYISTGEYEIYGNYNDFNLKDLKKIVSNKNQIYIFYDININDNKSSKLEILRNNATIYFYKNGVPSINSFKSDSLNSQIIKEEINDFINEKINNVKEPNNKSGESNLFSSLYSGSFREVKKPYGYLDCDYNVKKYRMNDISSLYIIESHLAFTPGKLASEIGGIGYESSWYNDIGTIKIKAERAENEVGYNQIKYGGTPVYKDAYPVNEPGHITITTTYGGGVTIGHSFTNGFSLSDIYFEESNTYGANILYSYNKSYTNIEPALVAQKDPEDVQKYTWRYNYSSPRNETNHLYLGYIFEMNNSNHDLLEGDMSLLYEYEFTVSDNGWWIFENTQTFSGYIIHSYY